MFVPFASRPLRSTGFGGTGSFKTQPNDFFDGYLEADYDGWYTAPTSAGKLAHINLYPNYATLGAPDRSQLGAPTYTEYLERFVAAPLLFDPRAHQ